LLFNNGEVISLTDKQNRLKSTVFNALSDPIRLEIVQYLRNGEKRVCEIVPHLSLIQPLVSRHLKILKDAGIVKCRKDGTKRMYAVVDDKSYNVIDALTVELLTTLSIKAFENITYN
jgi:DNA-binding transcriptional ArsR family regulator